jgi:hypothetical protein
MRWIHVIALGFSVSCGGAGDSAESGDELKPACDLVCDKGQHCELEEVVCITAPCPPIPVCVPDEEPTCKGVVCEEGYHCELEEVVCVRAPCPPQPTCVSDWPTCEDVQCAPDQTCELQEVTCIRAPCPPVPVCVP